MLSLFGLYVFTTALAGRQVISLDRARVLKDATNGPVGNFLGAIDAERLFSVIYLAAPTPANHAGLQAAEARTNRTTRALRAALTSGSTVSNASPAERRANARLLADVSGLPRLRSRIVARALSRPQALAAYSTVAGDAYALLGQVILQEPSAPIVSQALALVRMGRVEEVLQQENAILAGDMVARSFPPADAQQFTELVGARRLLSTQTLSDLSPANRTLYARNISAPAAAALVSFENAVTGTRPGRLPPVRPASWQRTVQAFAFGLERADAQGSAALDRQAVSDSRATELRLALAGGLGLLAVAASILVSLLVGRGLVRELTALSQAALDLADRRLPAVVHRLAAGEGVDVPTDELDIPARTDETREVAVALAMVRQTAIEAAVGQARLREGMNEVFRKLARRSQSLLHRQLTLLDSMERRARDPQLLEDLFRADHLTTRMRRNAENLIILSGQEPARGWRHPVPLVDVLRGAVAEVEDYTRIRVVCSASACLTGRAVGDVIHMIAELAENATAFSPPNTPVTMTGDVVGQGFAVEIEDRGLGMSEEKLAEANDRLARPPSFDPSGADQLGLFVAGQLAKRHDIRIHLRPNPYGGATAIVLIPRTLVAPEDEVPQGKPGEDGAPQTKGRHATRDERPAASADAPPSVVATATAASPVTETLVTEPAGRAEPGRPDLPRRVRQASLAEQLRNGVPLAAPPADEGERVRSPEEARTTMAAMQHGWERGRSLFDPPERAATDPGRPPDAARMPDPGGPTDPGPPPGWGGQDVATAGAAGAAGSVPAAPDEGRRPREGS
jgi:signal transduction histidine kinase